MEVKIEVSFEMLMCMLIARGQRVHGELTCFERSTGRVRRYREVPKPATKRKVMLIDLGKVTRREVEEGGCCTEENIARKRAWSGLFVLWWEEDCAP